MSSVAPSRRENACLIGVFCAALLLQFYLTTVNWTMGFMPGHEFRQAQTAIVSYYIDKDNNFSLLYETPILGKPWVSILLEVPVYEWSVVGLSRATGLPHVVAARTVSLICFYLALPAVYLLLGRLALSRPRRLLVLALILTCPVYIFYSRAFLMESMEVMCCAWFLLGFVRTMDERHWFWLALTIIAGTGAALIKSATFAVWLLPAAGYGVWLLWCAVRPWSGWRTPLQTTLWGAATVVPPLGALQWWINLTDPIKAAHASASIFTAKNLSQGNWGLLDFKARFSSEVWRVLLVRWQESIATPWVILPLLVVGLVFFRPERRRVLGLAMVFLLAQLMFPFAYAGQDYYYYACAVFLLAAIGIVLQGVLDSRLPRWGCGLIIAVPFLAQLTSYWWGYRIGQLVIADGGSNCTAAVRDMSPPNSVIIVAGADWAAMFPLYSQRKALMIRNGLEFNEDYLKRAFADLADEDVCALVLDGPVRNNRSLLNLAAERFNLDVSAPTFSQTYIDVYFSRPYIDGVRNRLRGSLQYSDLTFINKATGDNSTGEPFNISAGMARTAFNNISPAPFRARFAFGLDRTTDGGDEVLSAHPDSDIWLHAPANAKQIKWDFGFASPAYEREGDKTNGVEFIVTGETADGQRREIYRRLLDPVNQPGDRGRQREVIPYQPLSGETLLFSSRPNSAAAYDWVYWARIEVK